MSEGGGGGPCVGSRGDGFKKFYLMFKTQTNTFKYYPILINTNTQYIKKNQRKIF